MACLDQKLAFWFSTVLLLQLLGKRRVSILIIIVHYSKFSLTMYFMQSSLLTVAAPSVGAKDVLAIL